jgi:hypothetical protein
LGNEQKRSEYLDPETSDRSLAADVLVREEPDEEEDEEDEQDEDDDNEEDDDDDDGYSELSPPRFCTSSRVLRLRSGK